MWDGLVCRSVQLTAAVLLLFTAAADAGLLDKLFAPKPDLWPRWEAHDEGNGSRIEHGPWDRFLTAYTVEGQDGIVRVAYGKVNGDDRNSLADYISYLTSLPISDYSRAEQFAYWINLYNALTVETVLAHYPVKSIRNIDISPGFLADGPWRKKLVEIEGEQVSLDDIEHRILRPIWKDPRVHYAVNCASLGCPNLRQTAFAAENAGEVLDQAARAYVNHPRGVRVSGGRLTLSSIYEWFESDFAWDGGVLGHVRRYAEPPLAAEIAGFARAQAYEYDWTLNDAGNTGQ